MIGSNRSASNVHVARLLCLLATASLAACAVNGDAESNAATSQGLVLSSLPMTIQAGAMTTKTTGAQQGVAWNLWTNGYLAENVTFPSGCGFTLSIDAYGSPYAGVWPNMQVRIDQQVIANVTVNSATMKTYQVSTSITGGTHEIAIAFTNDAAGGGEDRNLFIKSMTISGGLTTTPPAPTPTTTPPPPPPPTPTGFDVKAFLAKYGQRTQTQGPTNEGNPSGVPTSWDWFTAPGARMLVSPPNTGWANWWSVAAVDTTEIRPANTRIEFRNARLLVLPLGGSTWTTYFGTAGIGGGGFKGDFTGGCAYGGVSLGQQAISLNPPAKCLDHIWSVNPAFEPMAGGAVRAAISIASVRLMKADPNGPDDRANSHFIINMGADWRSPDGACPTNASGQLVCYGILGSKFIYPKTYWRAAAMSTMIPAELDSFPLPPAELFRLPDGTFPTE